MRKCTSEGDIVNKTTFLISKMDCPSEERMIRMALDGDQSVKKCEFDLKARKMTAFHSGPPESILSKLEPLSLGSKIEQTSVADEIEEVLSANTANQDASELSVLKKVFLINGAMFFVGIIAGVIAESTGLISDSLDMFADATVFALSIYAVGRPQNLKKRAARISGYLQMTLTIFAFSEVIRRFIYGSDPVSKIMIGVAGLSLIANGFSMYLLASHREGDVHMRASWIFLSNDVIANIGVITAGILVSVLHSHVPDLVIGALIAIVVFSGALRILRASR